jgi:hypothetical protein
MTIKEIKSERFDFSDGAKFTSEEIESEIQDLLKKKRRQMQCGNLLLVANYHEDGTVNVVVSENYHQRTYKL